MKKSDSEIISAFLDNELSEVEVAIFKKRLQEDAVFANEFAIYRQNDLALKQHASLIDKVPVPESIMNLLRETGQDTQTSNSNVVQLRSWRDPKWLSLAASFLIVTLLAPALWYASNQDTPSLAHILSSEVSGQTIALDNDTQVTLVMSFKDRQGNFCREYRLSKSTVNEQTITCNISGQWETQVSDGTQTTVSQVYQTASSASSEKIERWLDENMDDIPFSTKMERKTLTK